MILTHRAPLAAAIGIPLAFIGIGWMLLWDLAVVIAIAADAILAASPAAVAATRSGPSAVRLGESAEVTLRLGNNGRRNLRGTVRDAWRPSAGVAVTRHPIAVKPGRVQLVSATLNPTRRGRGAADRVTVRSVGPLRIAGRQRSLEAPFDFEVLPPFTSRKHLPSKLARLRDLEGRNVMRAHGQGTEFDSLREYVPGDDVRAIDWRATARSRDVMIRTFRPERDRRVIIVVDTGRTSATRVNHADGWSGTRLDASLDAALLLAALTRRAGDRVDLLAYDTAVRADLRSAELQSISSAMTSLEPMLVQSDAGGMVAAILARVRQRSLVVLLTAVDPAPLQESLLPALPLLTARHRVLLASVADPSVSAMASPDSAVTTPAGAYSVAAGSAVASERAAMIGELHRRGVQVIDAPAGELAPALADAYLGLKAAGLL